MDGTVAAAKLHPEQVKAELRIRFGTIRAFEKTHRLADGSVRDVLRGRKSKRTQDAVALALKSPSCAAVHIDPESGGRQSIKRDFNPSGRSAHRQNGEGV